MDNAKGPFLLHVEGVNLSQVLEDTQNINVIRGASMALRDAAQDVGKWLTEGKLCPNAETIQTGASVGVFLLPVGQQAAQACRDAIVKRLNAADSLYRHFTFAVDIQRLTDFEWDRERLLAKIRFKQLRQGSLALPDPNDSTSLKSCPVDGLRPATTRATLKGKEEIVSASVASRLQYGRKNKKKFFEWETGDTQTAEMTWDLSEIALESPYPQLNGKLAYFYADGNSFGSVVEKAIGTADALTTHQRWDRHIQQKRRTFLSQLVGSGLHQRRLREDFTTPDGRRLRMEILLWGGDELLLVMPAWLGFHTANAFFQQSTTWDFGGQALTHAGGLVFCHHKTPVHRVRNLAKGLADRVKDQFSRKQSLYDYMVLESIDFPTESLDSFFARQYQTLAGCRQPLAPVDWDNLSKHWPDALFCLPKSQVYAIAQAAIGQGQAAFDKQCRRLKTLVGQATMTRAESELGSLFKTDAETMWRWVRLAELWDYLAPERVADPVGQPLAGSER